MIKSMPIFLWFVVNLSSPKTTETIFSNLDKRRTIHLFVSKYSRAFLLPIIIFSQIAYGGKPFWVHCDITQVVIE